ncbi:hypothetical protein [Streptomyces sp. NPDC059761]|uniref:hypothetical protein n=1 Tax=Streptomyces sp. NPDC059761 TaxID=3346937 RepID=UPI0036539E44
MESSWTDPQYRRLVTLRESAPLLTLGAVPQPMLRRPPSRRICPKCRRGVVIMVDLQTKEPKMMCTCRTLALDEDWEG